MFKYIISFIVPLFLTGCIGSYLGGHTNRLGDSYPDIRDVPERAEATKSFGVHKGNEKQERASDFKDLEKDREKMKARNDALREGRFPNLPKEEKPQKSTLGGKGAPSESAEPDKVAPSKEPVREDEATSSDQKTGIFGFGF